MFASLFEGAVAEPADEKPAVLSDFFAGAAAAEPTDSSQLPDSVLELPGNTEAEERPAKRRADAFSPLRAVLAKYQVDGYDVWHVPADDRPHELRFLDNLDHDMLVASLAGIPVRHGKDEIVMGTPQFIGGDHVAHGGHFRRKAYDSLLLQCPPLDEGIWTNRYDGTFAKFHASTCSVDSVPLIHEAVGQWNTFLERLGLPAANIVMNRRYDDGAKHIGWHSDDVKDLHELGLIVVLRTGRRKCATRRRSAWSSIACFSRSTCSS